MRYGEERCLREGTLCAVWRREVFERGDTVCGMEKRGVEREDTVCGMRREVFEKEDTVCSMEKRGI